MSHCQLQLCGKSVKPRTKGNFWASRNPTTLFTPCMCYCHHCYKAKLLGLWHVLARGQAAALFREVAFKTGTSLFTLTSSPVKIPYVRVGHHVSITEAPASTCPVVFPWTSTREQFSPPGLVHNWNLFSVTGKRTRSLPSSVSAPPSPPQSLYE